MYKNFKEQVAKFLEKENFSPLGYVLVWIIGFQIVTSLLSWMLVSSPILMVFWTVGGFWSFYRYVIVPVVIEKKQTSDRINRNGRRSTSNDTAPNADESSTATTEQDNTSDEVEKDDGGRSISYSERVETTEQTLPRNDEDVDGGQDNSEIELDGENEDIASLPISNQTLENQINPTDVPSIPNDVLQRAVAQVADYDAIEIGQLAAETVENGKDSFVVDWPEGIQTKIEAEMYAQVLVEKAAFPCAVINAEPGKMTIEFFIRDTDSLNKYKKVSCNEEKTNKTSLSATRSIIVSNNRPEDSVEVSPSEQEKAEDLLCVEEQDTKELTKRKILHAADADSLEISELAATTEVSGELFFIRRWPDMIQTSESAQLYAAMVAEKAGISHYTVNDIKHTIRFYVDD